MELLRLKCPGCHSTDIQYHSPYDTKNHGDRVIYKCEHCPVYFSETKNTVVSLNCRDEFGCFLSIVAFSMNSAFR
jgi:hypothetical protein